MVILWEKAHGIEKKIENSFGPIVFMFTDNVDTLLLVHKYLDQGGVRTLLFSELFSSVFIPCEI